MESLKFSIKIDTRATEIIRRDQNNAIVGSTTFAPGGVELCEAVIEYLKVNQHFLLSRLSAEQAIFRVGNALPTEDDSSIELVGRNLQTEKPQRRKISADMISDPIDRVLTIIVAQVVRSIRRIVSTRSSDLTFDNEIVLNGEYATLKGLDKRFEEALRAEAIPEAIIVIEK